MTKSIAQGAPRTPRCSQQRRDCTHYVDGHKAKPSEVLIQSADPCFHMYALITML